MGVGSKLLSDDEQLLGVRVFLRCRSRHDAPPAQGTGADGMPIAIFRLCGSNVKAY